MQIETVTVLQQQVLGGDYRVLKFASEKVAARIRPGQFVHLRVDKRNEHVLRRPFSVFKADRQSLTILFKIIGKGTEILSQLRIGDKVSIIGPLGNGFPMPAAGVYPLLIAGGYGSAALYLLAERSRKKGTILIGGKTANDILCADDFERLGWNVRITTEDGAAGETGLVTEVLIKYMEISKRVGREPPAPPDKKNRNGGAGTHAPYLGTSRMVFYACGPMAMLKAVSKIAIAGGLKAWLALDRHLGCGVGACLACVQKVKDGTKGWKLARVCTEGPVFECREIIWE